MTITEFKTACENLEQEYKTKISQAQNTAAVEELRVAALGRKGALTELLKGLKDFSIDDKKTGELTPRFFYDRNYPRCKVTVFYKYSTGRSGGGRRAYTVHRAK